MFFKAFAAGQPPAQTSTNAAALWGAERPIHGVETG